MWRSAEPVGLARAVALATLVLTACSVATPAPASTTPATNPPTTQSVTVSGQAPPASSDPTAAVTKVLPGSPASPCSGSSSDDVYRRARGCPITDRLEQRVHSSALQGMNPMCRCQSSAPMDVGTASTAGTTATVPVTFRTPTPFVITFALVREGADWRVDDTWCGNDQSTTIYATRVVSCGG